jgi:anti-sigma factor ChrR (cupin superfamily)
LTYAGTEKHIFKFDDVQWKNAGLPGAEIAILWGNEEDGSAVYAFRLQPGVTIPAHTHSNDYWGFAIQGKWEHIDENGHKVVTGQNAYALIRAKTKHADRCVGPEVCINILDFVGTRDIIFSDTPKKKD